MVGPCVVGGAAGPTVAVGGFTGVFGGGFVGGGDGGSVFTGGSVSTGGAGVSVCDGGGGSSGVVDGVNTGGVEVPDDGPRPGGGATGTVEVAGGGAGDCTGGCDVAAGIVVVTGTSDGAVGDAGLLGDGANMRGIWLVGAGAGLVTLAGVRCALR